ncbi:MAG: hypothetical protein ACLGH3_08270 [Actinomycetota bacterium]
MRKLPALALIGAVIGTVALAPLGASADESLYAGFAAKPITPVGPSPEGWDFWSSPQTGVWSEPYDDRNGNGCFDNGEAFTDDPRNSLIDPQSTAKFDGIWTNAGFGGKCAKGAYDDTWARVALLTVGDKTAALVSLDVVGFFYEEIERIRTELDAADPDHGVDMVVVASTHTHEGPDTMGLWSNTPYAVDGKFPLYQAYIRSQVVDGILEAKAASKQAVMKAATVEHTLGIRDSRPPNVIDPMVQAAQFISVEDGETLGTMVNWSNHPEALASGNPFISSDFPHGTRQKMESELGGTSVYFSGSVGGLMTPLGYNIEATNPATGEPYGSKVSLARTYYIGEKVADAAIAALADAPVESPSTLGIDAREVFMPGDNLTLRALNAAGIFDKPTYTAGVDLGRLGDEFKTQLVSVALGSVRFQTVPGELFPEIELGGYGRPDCPQADTGRPYEPIIRDQWDDEHLFVLGLGQDELGYIVPGYDFWMYGAPNDEQPRPLVDIGALEKTDPCGESHYEETVSGSSVLAPVVACTVADLAGKDPYADPEAYPACTSENTTTGPQGLHLDSLIP